MESIQIKGEKEIILEGLPKNIGVYRHGDKIIIRQDK